MRYAVQPYTFSDGTYVPAGSYLATPPVPLHLDESTYDQAHEFDPFRFDVINDAESTRRHFTSTDLDYLAFGHGQSAANSEPVA
jgi:cytochrome P450